MLVERTVVVSQVTLRDSIAGISGLIEEAVLAFCTPIGHYEITRTEN